MTLPQNTNNKLKQSQDNKDRAQRQMNLWENWQKTGHEAYLSALMGSLANKIRQDVIYHKKQYLKRLPANEGNNLIEELIANAQERILRYLPNYNPIHDASIETYLGHHIAFSVIDFFREKGRQKNGTSRRETAILAQINKLEKKLNREPTSEEVHEQLSDRFGKQTINSALMKKNPIPTDDLYGNNQNNTSQQYPENEGTENQIEQLEFVQTLNKAISLLNEKQRRIFKGHLIDGTSLTAIGKENGISQSRASQIFGEAVKEVQYYMQASGYDSRNDIDNNFHLNL